MVKTNKMDEKGNIAKKVSDNVFSPTYKELSVFTIEKKASL